MTTPPNEPSAITRAPSRQVSLREVFVGVTLLSAALAAMSALTTSRFAIAVGVSMFVAFGIVVTYSDRERVKEAAVSGILLASQMSAYGITQWKSVGAAELICIGVGIAGGIVSGGSTRYLLTSQSSQRIEGTDAE